ncbi:MAG: 4-hydroxybutyrate dehydrogenase [Suipraeoptans sp.]
MKELLIAPEIQKYDTFKEFANEMDLGSKDVILTNEYIYNPIMKEENLECSFIFQEKYGAGEPTDVMIDSILADFNKIDCNRVVAVGGGTIIDIAKILILKDATNVDVLFDKATLEKEKELVIVPTTCGTGSEVTNLSIINRTRKGTKMGLGVAAMYADYAVMIPEFLKTLPYYVFATSSIDALIHAIESYLGPKRTAYTAMFSVEAIKEILVGYCDIANNGEDRRFELSENFLRASNYAGIAFGNSGCAAVHAMSYALGGKYHVPHGESNYQFFTDVLWKYKEKKPDGLIGELSDLILNIAIDNDFKGSNSGNGITLLSELLSRILVKKNMSEFGVTQDDIESFAQSTVDNQQRLLSNNYVTLTKEDIRCIYQSRL